MLRETLNLSPLIPYLYEILRGLKKEIFYFPIYALYINFATATIW